MSRAGTVSRLESLGTVDATGLSLICQEWRHQHRQRTPQGWANMHRLLHGAYLLASDKQLAEELHTLLRICFYHADACEPDAERPQVSLPIAHKTEHDVVCDAETRRPTGAHSP